MSTPLLERAKSAITKSYFAPKTWEFWRATIVCFCLCCFLGHAMEVPYCHTMDALFGIVEDDYAVFIDPWYVPYWVYGGGAFFMTFLLEPFKEHVLRRRRTVGGALLEFYIAMVLISMVLELVFGLICNQPDINGVYPYWDNSQLPLNVFKQAWLVNDVFIGLVAMIYLWLFYPLVSTLLSKMPSWAANAFTFFCICFLTFSWMATVVHYD